MSVVFSDFNQNFILLTDFNKNSEHKILQQSFQC